VEAGFAEEEVVVEEKDEAKEAAIEQLTGKEEEES